MLDLALLLKSDRISVSKVYNDCGKCDFKKKIAWTHFFFMFDYVPSSVYMW